MLCQQIIIIDFYQLGARGELITLFTSDIHDTPRHLCRKGNLFQWYDTATQDDVTTMRCHANGNNILCLNLSRPSGEQC